MGFGGGGGGSPKVEKVTSTFDKVQNTGYNTDFGNASTRLQSEPGSNNRVKQIVTNTSLAPQLQASNLMAQQGLTNNLSGLNRSLPDQVSYLQGGQDPFYNVMQNQLKRQEDQAYARTALGARRGGLTNSTTAGAAQGAIANDAVRRQQEGLLQALNFGQQYNTNNANTNLGAISQLYNMSVPLGAQTNQSLITALQQRDAARMFNAQAQNQANMAQYQQQQNQPSFLGAALPALGAIGGMAFGGGAGAGLGGSIGGGLSNLFGGGSSSPSNVGGGFGAFMGSQGLGNPFGQGFA